MSQTSPLGRRVLSVRRQLDRLTALVGLLLIILVVGCDSQRPLWDKYKQLRDSGNYKEAIDVLVEIEKKDQWAKSPNGEPVSKLRDEVFELQLRRFSREVDKAIQGR